MGKDKKDDGVVKLTPYEEFCTNFLARISMVCAFIFMMMVLVFILILSKNNCATQPLIDLNYPNFIYMVVLCLSGIASLLTIVPVVFQMMIYMVEDLPDQKIPIKRGVNRIIIGLLLFAFIILCMVLPAICQSREPLRVIVFVIGLLSDIACNFFKLEQEKPLSYKILIPVFVLSGIVVISAYPSPLTFIMVFISKIAVLFSLDFISLFQSAEDGKKKNIKVLSIAIIASLNCIILYFIFQDIVEDYIINEVGSIVNQLYGFFAKLMKDDPTKLSKIFACS